MRFHLLILKGSYCISLAQLLGRKLSYCGGSRTDRFTSRARPQRERNSRHLGSYPLVTFTHDQSLQKGSYQVALRFMQAVINRKLEVRS